jgi:hypothetical protein
MRRRNQTVSLGTSDDGDCSRGFIKKDKKTESSISKAKGEAHTQCNEPAKSAGTAQRRGGTSTRTLPTRLTKWKNLGNVLGDHLAEDEVPEGFLYFIGQVGNVLAQVALRR